MKIEITPESSFVFSGGEVHSRVSNYPLYPEPCTIVCRDYTAQGLLALCQHVEILRRLGTTEIHLVYPYLPYARQDRVMVNEEPFSLKCFCDIVNLQRFDSVTIYDPHSDVGPALIDRCRVIPQDYLAKQSLGVAWKTNEVVLVSPDAGAYKKVSKFARPDAEIAIGTKKRDVKGHIVETGVLFDGSLEGRRCLILDDICDGGRTFVTLAAALKLRGAKEVALYVTHGIFSKGFQDLKVDLDAIYTTDSFRHESLPEFVTVTEIPC